MNQNNIISFDQPITSGFLQVEDPTKLHPATPEEIAIAGKSGAELVADSNKRASKLSEDSLKKQMGRYGKVRFSKFTPTKVFECRQLLESGEDPFLLAVYLNVDFGEVARLANNVIKVRCEHMGWPLIEIPTTVPGYLKLQERRLIAAEEKEKAAQVANQEVIKG